MLKEIITKQEAERFQKDLNRIIGEMDFTNPIEAISFANSLIDMGKHYLAIINNRLVQECYSEEDIKKFLEKVE